MPKQITRYRCDFCKKHYADKYYTGKHEERCLFNPKNKSCGTCFYADDKCLALDKEIFVKGEKVVNCESWRENEYCPEESE